MHCPDVSVEIALGGEGLAAEFALVVLDAEVDGIHVLLQVSLAAFCLAAQLTHVVGTAKVNKADVCLES